MQLRKPSVRSMKRIVVAIVAMVWAASPALAQPAAGRPVVALIADTPLFLIPDLEREPLRTLPSATILTFLDEQGDWYHVEFQDAQYGRRVGYVHKKSAVFIQPRSAPTEPQSAAATTEPPMPGVRPSEVVAPAPAPPAAPAQTTPRPPRPEPRPSTSIGRTKGKDVTIRGYVTAVNSPTEFEIEDYRITRDQGFVLDFENASPDLQFQVDDIRVGVELEIKGSVDEAGDLSARSIKVDLEQFRAQKQTAILAQPPVGVSQTAAGWTGVFLVDGQRIQVTPATQVVFQLTRREKSLAKKAKSRGDEEPAFEPLRSLADVTIGMAMTYEGKRDREGTIIATRVEFAHNDLESGEKRMWDSLKVSDRGFDDVKALAGDLRINQVGRFKTVPDRQVQDYVNRIGHQLIPEYQRNLPEAGSGKIPFRFYVVENRVPNAFALPNGIVVIHSSMFDVLENEAQFAAIVGHEIAHAIQEHTWRQQQYQKGKRMALAIGAAIASAYRQNGIANALTLVQAAMQNGYARSLENQSDRLGLEYMVNAGYDPREAPRVWKVMTKKMGDTPTDFFWSNHDNNSTRRSYLMNELKNNYSRLDYSKFQTNDSAFADIASRVRSATSGKRRLRVVGN